MIADELPPAPAGKDYQIWFIADGKPVPGGVFKPDARGHVEMHDQVPAAARGATAFAITLEPQGGTPAPTAEGSLALPHHKVNIYVAPGNVPFASSASHQL